MSKAVPQPQVPAAQPRAHLDFPTLLERSKGEIQKILPEGMDVDRVARIALSVYKLDSKIQGCTPVSILASVMKACELGLEPGGALGHAYLIPYGKECTFQPSYKGLLELAWRTGHYREIDAVIVHENDVFEVVRDPRPLINHRPNFYIPGAEVGAYAYAIYTNGETAFEFMNRAEIEKVRTLSKAGPVWNHWWAEMAKKTVLKRFLKDRRLSPQLAQAIECDHEAMAYEAPRPAITSVPPGTSRAAALAMRLRGEVEPAPEEAIEPEVAESEAAGGLEPDAGMRG